MSVVVNAINTAWMLSCRREFRRFQKSTTQVESTQVGLLRQMINSNSNTEFGCENEFSSIQNYEQFAARVPISNYDDLRPYIDRICDGQQNVLTREPVLTMEPTSGTTTGRKLIPYTRTLRLQMQRAVSAWIANLYQDRPAVRRGTAYWSISPAFGQTEKTIGGLRIGFADDTEYLGRLARTGIRRVLAVSPEVARANSVEAFQRETLVQLLQARDLALISVWSPTFLSTLVKKLFNDADEILDELSIRNWNCGQELASILSSSVSQAAKLKQIWPSLAIISCWADGMAADYLHHLQDFFPDVEIQPKGLLATEAFVSFPIVGRTGSALAIRSHFFEFGLADDNEAVSLAHELKKGNRYIPIVTTGSGLYRYRTNDVIEVVGFENECPLIRFSGRGAGSVDLVGEKIDESFVRLAIQNAVRLASEKVGDLKQANQPLAMLIPVAGPPARYQLFLEANDRPTFTDDRIARCLEKLLRQNPHYEYARQIGQLDSVDVKFVTGASGTLWSNYEAACVDSGIRIGDIKPTALCCNQQVAGRFQQAIG